MTHSGTWGEPWSAAAVTQLRSALGVNKTSFAERLEVHRRTARRWEQGDTTATDHRIITALDDLLCETVCQVAPWLTPIQVRQMQRRDVLRLLATGTFVPLSGVPLLRNGSPHCIGTSTLTHLQTVSAGLAGLYATVPADALIGPAAGHLEEATHLLRESMLPSQRQQLHTIIGDLGVFLGYLSFNTHRPAQASAYFHLAEDHAREADDHELLVRAMVASSCVHSNIANGQRLPSQAARTILEHADDLVRQVTPRLQALVTVHLAEERAASRDERETHEALSRSEQAFAVAEDDVSVGYHPCAVADYHSLSNGEGLDGYRGVCEILLGRGERATDILTNAFTRTHAPRRQSIILTDLAEAFSQQDEPHESCARLDQAYLICQEHYFPLGVQRIFGVRARFPESFTGLDCVTKLDERLGLR